MSDITDRRETGWRDIKSAPFNVPVRVKLGEGMSIVARLIPDASMTSDERTCDEWQAEFEGEHPECWSDGCCWESNADDMMSMQPTHWMPFDHPLSSAEQDELVARINANPNLQPLPEPPLADSSQ
jgi:hypothetical protein